MFMHIRNEVTQDSLNWYNSPGGSPYIHPEKASQRYNHTERQASSGVSRTNQSVKWSIKQIM